MEYSFDPRMIKKFINQKSNNNTLELKKEHPLNQALMLLEKDENKALACIFSTEVLERYDKRTFKGLEINKNSEINKKIHIGKRGLPIHYEDIDQTKVFN